jgi:hypothetical protein
MHIANESGVLDFDTVRFGELSIDPCSRANFSTEIKDFRLILYYNDVYSKFCSYSRYFSMQDSLAVIYQTNDNSTKCWDLDQFHFDNFLDSTLVKSDSLKFPDLDIWLEFHNDSSDYFTLSKPLYNKDKNKAIISTELYLEDYYLISVLEFNNISKGQWYINSKYSLAYKVWIEDIPNDDEFIKIGMVYLGSFESFPEKE